MSIMYPCLFVKIGNQPTLNKNPVSQTQQHMRLIQQCTSHYDNCSVPKYLVRRMRTGRDQNISDLSWPVFHLCMPHENQADGGSYFLTSVVQYFAKAAGANLVTLGIDDMIDLAVHFGLSRDSQADLGNSRVQATREHDDMYINKNHTRPRDNGPCIEEAEFSQPMVFALIELLQSSPGINSEGYQVEIIPHDKSPLIIHIAQVTSILNVFGYIFVQELQKALLSITPNSLIISTSAGDKSPDNSDTHALEQVYLGKNRPQVHRHHRQRSLSRNSLLDQRNVDTNLDLICIIPNSNRTQRRLFNKHREIGESYKHHNIRLLQRLLRQSFAELTGSSLVQPYTDWAFLEGTPANERLAKKALDEAGLNEILCSLRCGLSKEDSRNRDTVEEQTAEAKIKAGILNFGRRKKAVDDWYDKTKDESRWSDFPPHVQNTIRKIENDDSLEWERRFLELLINPNDVEEGWSDIALEPDIKDSIQKTIDQPTQTDKRSYGILKRGRIGGALLYGPPGTGKTHLARVLARESKTITICVSAAQIEDKYVGEAEKAIQGLFNLAHMLSPCTIFLDEADALLRSRSSDDRSWERSRVNQLLHEMDGFKKSESSPFVILATNLPNDLDPAVLRRVPARIHIGLPSFELRKDIFQISLKEEILHTDVDLDHLARRSEGYSGSDIQTVCVQAALLCDTFVGEDEKRCLRNVHFEKAMRRCAPTVSRGALDRIEGFSREYDPAALERGV